MQLLIVESGSTHALQQFQEQHLLTINLHPFTQENFP
jgi:hypothetical protein